MIVNEAKEFRTVRVHRLHGHLHRIRHIRAVNRHRRRHPRPQIGRRIVDMNKRLVFLHIRLPPTGRLGVLIDLLDLAVQHAVVPNRPDVGRHPGSRY